MFPFAEFDLFFLTHVSTPRPPHLDGFLLSRSHHISNHHADLLPGSRSLSEASPTLFGVGLLAKFRPWPIGLTWQEKHKPGNKLHTQTRSNVPNICIRKDVKMRPCGTLAHRETENILLTLTETLAFAYTSIHQRHTLKYVCAQCVCVCAPLPIVIQSI